MPIIARVSKCHIEVSFSLYPPCVGIRGCSVFAASTGTILLSNFVECSRHPVESVSVIGLLLSGPCRIAKGLSEICGQAALRAGDADNG